MDIKNINNNLMNNSRLNDSAKPAEKALASQQEATKAPADKVTLTSLSNQIRDIEKRAQMATTSNDARIAELKQAINDGSYKVDANSVADKLIKTELLLARS
jgi:negative regulator of flagellin synthesis FlgM